jgi:hypothetical protein
LFAAAGERHSLQRLARDVLATCPLISSGSTLKCDPRFYLVFWALELPDICTATESAYRTFQNDLTAELSRVKSRLYALKKELERCVSEAQKPANFRGYGGGPLSSANELPIVTQDDVDAAEATRAELEAKLQLIPGEKEGLLKRSTEWGSFFESHAVAFRLVPGIRNFYPFIQVRDRELCLCFSLSLSLKLQLKS